MKYEIEKIEDGKLWNEFVEQQNSTNILSSWQWIEFERSLGFDTRAYSFSNKGGVFAFRVVNAKKGKYILLKQNIFVDWRNEDLVKSLISFLKERCKELGCSFFRISPPLIFSKEYDEFFQRYGFQKSVLSPMEAQLTTILDLEKGNEEILKEMRKNTRYSIRKGEKMGVEVLHTEGDEYLKDFEKIYSKTVGRHKWNAEDFEYIKNQYSFFSSCGFSRMFVAKYKGDILAIAIFTKFQNQVIYHHSGSITTGIPVMYVLMWEAIKYYKELGVKEFNFFGVSEKEDVGHSWHGLSLFKRGFGGKEKRLMGFYDFPLSWRYWFVRRVESFKG